MYGKHALADLVAHYLHGKSGLVAIYRAAMDQQTAGFVDRNQVFVPVNHLAVRALFHGRIPDI